MQHCHAEAAQAAGHDDFTAFRYLIGDWHLGDAPLTELLDADGGYCGHESAAPLSARTAAQKEESDAHNKTEAMLERMLKRAWLLELRVKSLQAQRAHCGDFEHLVYSPLERESRCICNAADVDQCHALRHNKRHAPHNYSLTAIVVFAVAGVLFFATRIYTECAKRRAYAALIARAHTAAPDDVANIQKEFSQLLKSRAALKAQAKNL